MRARRTVQDVIVLRTSETSEVATPRRGSNPARRHMISMVRQGRAEIFALPAAVSPYRRIAVSPLRLDVSSLLTSK
jgi:hypothetical protein